MNFYKYGLHNIFINMAYPNFKKGLKMAFGPSGVKHEKKKSIELLQECQ
jgi:hypothetical protein